MQSRSRLVRWATAAAACWILTPTAAAHAEPTAAPIPPRVERYSTGMLVSGIVVTSATVPSLLGGLALRMGSTALACPGGCALSGTQKTGIGLMIGSAAAFATGITLVAIGNRRVPAAEPSARVFLGLGSATLHVSF
jgi:hypothetical protein